MQKRLLGAASLVGVAALLMSACGGSTPTPAATGDAAATTTTPAATSTTTGAAGGQRAVRSRKAVSCVCSDVRFPSPRSGVGISPLVR